MKSVHLALCTLVLTPALTAYASRQILPGGLAYQLHGRRDKDFIEDHGRWRSCSLPGEHNHTQRV